MTLHPQPTARSIVLSSIVSAITRMLESLPPDQPTTSERLLPLVYDELRRVAAHRLAHEQPGHTLQPTALVHEAWLRLGAANQPPWQSRRHFFNAAAEAMRRILIDRARRRKVRELAGYAKREDDWENSLIVDAPNDELLAVNDALGQLAAEDATAAELVKLRYFAGLTMPEAAEALGVPQRSTERLWTFARAWLRNAISTRPAAG